LIDFKNILKKLEFINISTDDFTIFEWKPERSYKSFILDMNILKQNPMRNIFFHVNKGNLKIAYIRYDNQICSAGADTDMQFQLLEALIEEVHKLFNETYDVGYILSYGNFSSGIFNKFKTQVNEIIANFEKLRLVKVINIPCPACNKTLPLIIKNSFIKNAESYPVPIVYTHNGHAILAFIDMNFNVRGVELVNMTG
jgi:hypothetical protein